MHMQKLLILANSGRVRYLVFKEAGDDLQEKAHLLEGPGSPVEMRPASIQETVTDQAGRFRKGGPVGSGTGASHGDENNLEVELEREAIQRIAAKIDEIVTVANPPSWQLVTPSTILRPLQDHLSEPVRRILAHSETGDLTKLPLADLEKRFLGT
jgi:hypothetical protein